MEKGQVYRDLSDGNVYRLLYIDNDAGVAYIISLASNSSLPYMVDLEPLQAGIDNKSLVLDPSAAGSLPNLSDLTVRQQDEMAARWGLIRAFVADEPSCYQEYPRSKFILSLHKATGISDSSIRRMLHRYWASGGTIAALVPRYELRGRHKSPFK